MLNLFFYLSKINFLINKSKIKPFVSKDNLPREKTQLEKFVKDNNTSVDLDVLPENYNKSKLCGEERNIENNVK
jgi:hypothetical protein